MKYSMDDIISACKQTAMTNDELDKVIQYLETVAQEEAGDKQPRIKRKVLVVQGGEEKTEGFDGYAWVLKAPQDLETTLMSEIEKVIVAFNETKKGQKTPVQTIPQAFEYVPKKLFKDFGLDLLTKEPCLGVNISKVADEASDED